MSNTGPQCEAEGFCTTLRCLFHDSDCAAEHYSTYYRLSIEKINNIKKIIL